MRPIDADALREQWLANGLNEPVYVANDVVGSIDAAPTIDLAGQWISVDDRLPGIKEHYVSDTVLVWCQKDEVMCFSELEQNIFGQVLFGVERPSPYGEERPEVTHWMPLPAPPKAADATESEDDRE